jgi:hypothetical protein
MKLKFKPYQPDIFSLVFSEQVENAWKEYQKSLFEMFS